VRGDETCRAAVHEREEVGALDCLGLENVSVVDINAAQVEAQAAVGPRVTMPSASSVAPRAAPRRSRRGRVALG
jgi:hypothetical protein